MITKLFSITSNSNEFLSAHNIAEILMKQVTLSKNCPKIFFAVRECENKSFIDSTER